MYKEKARTLTTTGCVSILFHFTVIYDLVLHENLFNLASY
jgi:hypothetical protein